MGYFSEKIINEQKAYYWTVSKRDGKKNGGTGKVKKIERYLGDRRYLFSEQLPDSNETFYVQGFCYLSWYVWNNDIKFDEFIDKLVAFEIKDIEGKNQLDFVFTKQKEVVFIKNKNSKIDLRTKFYRWLKTYINRMVKSHIKSIQLLPLIIDEIIESLEKFNDCIRLAKEVNKKTDIDSYWHFENIANYWFDRANKKLDKILDHVPRTQREEAKKKIWGHCLRECPLEKLDL